MQWCVHQRLKILCLALCVRPGELAAEKSATNAMSKVDISPSFKAKNQKFTQYDFYVPHSNRCRDARGAVQSAHATLYPRPGQCQGDAPPSTHQHRSGCGEGSDAALLQVKTDLLSASVSDCSLCSGWSPVSGCIKPVTSSSNKVELMRSFAWNLEHS